MNPAVASMYHGHDVLRERSDSVESLLSGGTVGELKPQRNLRAKWTRSRKPSSPRADRFPVDDRRRP